MALLQALDKDINTLDYGFDEDPKVSSILFIDIDRDFSGAGNASFKAKISLSAEGAKTLSSASKPWPGVHPAFLPNLLGRGDYWAPHCHTQFSKKDVLETVGTYIHDILDWLPRQGS
jgi:hypothetical protein